AKRHKLRLMYFDSSRSSSEHFSEEVDFADTTFPVNLEIGMKFQFEIAELAYEYDFLRRDNYEVGASIGVHYVDFLTRLTGKLGAGNSNASGTLEEQVHTQAPLPVVGLFGNWRIGRDFYLQAHAQYFQLKLGEYDGRLLDYQAALVWQLSDHLALGTAYNLFDTRLAVDRDDFQGNLDWQYDGAQLFVRTLF
ncbi:MAG TPA: hypothetical protein VIT67_21690, partial [Povalibacter sp.]